ncbi:Mpo1-like protein [Pseudomonas sp. RAC1]|uniref:Mpo1-like protein n=1 Tax=Pseudomonas sp. RAC1 TaxID=3064900 RepID=UPI002724D4F1|nr:Mpo1-like protein [Pseudomonas sp. RAC1]MDV9032260.1 Mpo1-like protein [Pseudomonas sp. RAC1]
MSKRLPNLPAWQWRGYHHHHRHPANLVLHLIAVPLFILACLLLLSGLFAMDLTQLAVGALALIAALGMQRQGHRLEAEQPEPFSDRSDAFRRLLTEQFVTFPRFVLSGGWLRAWRERHRHRR